MVAWSRLHAGFDLRHASPVVRGWLRIGYGLGRVLARAKVPPMSVTAAAFILNVGVPVATLFAGAWPAAAFLVAAALADTLDGAVAVLTSRTTRLGNLYDGLVDRLAEVCWLAAFWVIGAPAWLLVVAGAVAWLHEYIRARATAVSLISPGTTTVGERITRLYVTLIGLLVAGLAGQVNDNLEAGTVTIATVIWVFLGFFGVAELLSDVRKSLR